MTLEDLSNSFDLLLDSYANKLFFGEDSSRADIRYDEYEKSLFLTEAQEDLVMSLYNGRNPFGESFEETEQLRRFLASLVVEKSLSPIENTTNVIGIDSRSRFFTLPADLWFITYESVNTSDSNCGEAGNLDVVPVRQDEYNRIRKNPFRGPNNMRALRLDLADGVVEVVCKYNVTEYYIRYLKRVKPIVLVNLPDGLKIHGISTATSCSLHESLHHKLLEVAVEKALRSKGYRGKSNNKENN